MAHRFARDTREAFDDGWQDAQAGEGKEEGGVQSGAAPKPLTAVTLEEVRSVITRNDSPDIHFVSGPRARLQLLLRATNAQLPEPVAGAGF